MKLSGQLILSLNLKYISIQKALYCSNKNKIFKAIIEFKILKYLKNFDCILL